jgi:hypothetical protein
LKLERIQFKQNVFDPKSSKGADNVRTFFKADQGYDIDLDAPTGLVRVACNGRSLVIHISNAWDCRELLTPEGDAAASAGAPVLPKFTHVKTAEGAYKVVPIAPPAVPSEPEPDEAAPPSSSEAMDEEEPQVQIPPRRKRRPTKNDPS